MLEKNNFFSSTLACAEEKGGEGWKTRRKKKSLLARRARATFARGRGGGIDSWGAKRGKESISSARGHPQRPFFYRTEEGATLIKKKGGLPISINILLQREESSS